MKTKIKNPKGFEKSLQELLRINGITITIFKYKNFRITKTPNSNHPEMVTITRCTSELKHFLGKSFETLEKSKVFIDYQQSLLMIEQGRIIVRNQLLSLGIGETNW